MICRTGPLDKPWQPPEFHLTSACIGSGAPGDGDLGHTFTMGYAWQDPESARFVAMAEGAERYAGLVDLGEPSIWATAAELAGECLEPERYPRCTEREYAHPKCPVAPFEPGTPIRWVRGFDLRGREPIWAPAAMATYGLRDKTPAERFSYPISTGYAVHTDATEAVVRGICEVVERDIVSVLWLQRLPLPLVGAAERSEPLSHLREWCRRRFMTPHLFDATSDLGVPTVYCVLVAEHDPHGRQVVGAGTARTLVQAAEKALAEALMMRSQTGPAAPAVRGSPDDFTELEDTLRYMAIPERAEAFDFLIGDAESRPTTTRPALPDDPAEALGVLVDRLAARDMRPVVVDRTASELADVGLTAVSVIIPDLQPMSPKWLAQFRAHPRLYSAPASMGYRVLCEEELNPWPQPFP